MLLGSGGHDRLEGGIGDDDLSGGIGNDDLMGQTGDPKKIRQEFLRLTRDFS